MFKLLSIVCSFYLINVSSLKFTEYINKYNKEYSDDEITVRLSIYKDNLRKIQEHNEQNHSWKMDVNQFTDLTESEFKTKSGSICFDKNQKPVFYNFIQRPYEDLPETFDWVEKGAVTDVKDQKSCGSCYAFSTTGAVEGAYFVATGKLVSLSEQEIVDCSGSFGNQGCNGGLMNYGFDFIKNKGICLEKDYSYKAATGLCKKCKSVTKVSSYVNVQPFDETALQQAVFKSPVSIAIEADTSIFQSYSSGVMDSDSCGTSLDHGVLVVGWGTLNGKKYWKVKNSWGSSWGDKGYILLGRGNNICGLATEPSYPVINKSELH
jgi:C1A family cysteine protease